MKRSSVGWALVVLGATWSGTVRANGRFPRALHLVEDTCDPNHLVLAATFGLISTFDGGAHWYHTCERAFSLQDAYNGDPLVMLMGNGALLVNAQTGIYASPSESCGFASSLVVPNQSIADFTVSRKAGEVALAVVSNFAGASPVHQLRQSRDGGAAWETLGTPLPVNIVYTVDVAPSDPHRIYATGIAANGQGVLLRSNDSGATWTSTPLADTNSDAAPYLAAVHPSDPNKIFVRTDAWTNRAVVDTAADALLYSDDGGATFRTVLPARRAKLLGFALSPDGQTVLAGYGDTMAAEVDIDPAATGLFAAPLDTLAFTQVREGSITCLTWSSRGVFMCTPEMETGFQLGLAPSPMGVLTPVLRLADLQGPLPGCATSCDWSTICVPFAACDHKPPPGAAVGPAKRCGGPGDGGAAGTTPMATPEAGALPTPVPAGGSSGCAVSARPGRSGEQYSAMALLLGALLGVARRRQRR